MMTFALLFAGWAYAEDETGAPNEPTFDITITIGNGGEAVTTGIYNNAYAHWAEDIEDAIFFETPHYLTYEYQLLTDGSQLRPAEPDADPVVLGHEGSDRPVQFVSDGTQTPVRSQFVMDKLVPNRLYRVRVSFPGDEVGELHQSDWYYFISAVPQLVPGKLVWNWEPAKAIEGTDPVEYEYEYGTEAQQAENNGGNLRWQFSDFNKSISELTTIPDGVRGRVVLYTNDEAGNPTTSRNTITGSQQMRSGRTYKVEASATYTYREGEIVTASQANNYGIDVYVQRGDNKTVTSTVVTRGPRTWGGTTIDPSDIHVGIRENAQGEAIATLVALENLPADMPNTAMGALYYKTADMDDYEAIGANMWFTTRVAEFNVPTTEDFTFYIQIFGIVDGKLKLFEMRDKDGKQIYATLTDGSAKEFDLTDRNLLWTSGEQGAYVLPVDEVVAEGDYTLTFRRAGGQANHKVNGVASTDADDNSFITFDLADARPRVELTQEEEFASMSISIDGEDYLNELKKEWKFFTSEGAKVYDRHGAIIPVDVYDPENVFDPGNENALAYIDCEDNVFSGDVYAIDPRVDPVVPLMSVDDPTQPAPLYFFDWAWTPGTTPSLKDIQIEHNDYVKHVTTNADRTEDSNVEFKSQITYKRLPKVYNNAQAITKLTITETSKELKVKKGDPIFTFEREVANVADLTAPYTFDDGDWGKQIFEFDENLYGPLTLISEVAGEVPEGGTRKSSRAFTIAPREGKIQLGSAEVDGWDEVEDEPAPEYIETNTLVNGVLSLVPQFVIHNIYNWNWIYDVETETALKDGECGQCDFTIYAWLENPDGTIAKSADDTAEFSETSATGSINELGEVVLNNKLLFVNVDYKTTYILKGYMLYTPQRYGLLTANKGLEPVNEAVEGPVVKVPFEYIITTGPEFPEEAPENSRVKYYIAEEDLNQDTPVKGEFVEARVYDMEGEDGTVIAGEIGVADNIQLVVQLITKNNYPAPVQGKWVPATADERGYFRFYFPVDNDPDNNNLIRDTYQYNFKYFYQQGTQHTTVAIATGDEGINTPDPYLLFVKHAPDGVVPADEISEEVGPWKLEEYCATLTNFFAFTEDDLPTGFENWEEYWGNDEKAKNLVYEYEPEGPSAPGRRAFKEAEIEPNGYAPIVRLDDDTEFYFNNEFFMAGDAKYTGTFTNKDRTVVVPFLAETDAEVRCLNACYLDESGTQVIFHFARKKDQDGNNLDELTPGAPYLVKPAAKGDVFFTGEEVVVWPSNITQDATTTLTAGGTLMEMSMVGLYEKTLAKDIISAEDWNDDAAWFYRYSQDASTFLKMHKTEEYMGGVMQFQCYLRFKSQNNGNIGYGIGFRFDDEDATMIESINVVTESSELFDVMGRKVIEPVKGQIYIQNGKKILF